MPPRRACLALLVALALGAPTACSRPAPAEAETAAPTLPLPPPPPRAPSSDFAAGAVASASPAGSGSRGASPPPLSSALARPAAGRVVAIGDLHGDLDAARRALRLAGAVDAGDRWIGGALVVVQTGDEIDRADGDRAVLDLFDRLAIAARTAGGAVVALEGNHELMNASLDFRYVTPGGFAAFDDVAPRADGGFSSLPTAERGRAAAFAPGGPYAIDLATRPLFVVIGDTVFVHAGLLPAHVRYGLDRMNAEAAEWLRGKRSRLPSILESDDGPLWTRRYSTPGVAPDCAALGEVLGALGARRMVVGHTVQSEGITGACGDRVFRIDTGMSRAFGGRIEALEIRGDTVTILREGA